MAIDYNSLVSKPQATTTSSKGGLDYNTLVASKPATQKQPTQPVEPPKTFLQKAGAVGKDLGIGIAKPFVKTYELLSQSLPVMGTVAFGGAQLLAGNKEGFKRTAEGLKSSAVKIEEERSKPIEFGGQQIERIKTPKEAVGTALELASYAIGAGEAMAAKNIIKQTLATGLQYGSKQAALTATKQVAKRMAIGGVGGATYGAGSAMQENKDAKNIAIDAAKNFGIGAAFELGMLGLGAGGAVVARKFENVLKGAKPMSAIEREAAARGESYLPSKIKVGEEIKNASDNNISYKKEVNLGHDANGEPIMSRVEINPKTGKATVVVSKQLDKNPGQKALVIENAHDDIVRLKMGEKPTLENGGIISRGEVKPGDKVTIKTGDGQPDIIGTVEDVGAKKSTLKMENMSGKLEEQGGKQSYIYVRNAKGELEQISISADFEIFNNNFGKQGSKTVAQKTVDDFAIRISKTEAEIKAALEKELKQYGGDLVVAKNALLENPVAVKEKAPTVAALLEHQTDPNISIVTTSIKDLQEKHIKSLETEMLARAEKNKADQAIIKPSEETYAPKAAQKLEQEAIERKIMESPVGIPEVERVHIKDQIALHAEIEADRNLIDKILLGEIEAPGKLKSASVWRIESEKAMKNGDIGMIQKLANSPLARQFSEEGANIAMLRGMDIYNPVNVIKKIKDLRIKAKGGAVKEKTVANEIKDAIKKVAPNKQSWSDFIEEIKCK